MSKALNKYLSNLVDESSDVLTNSMRLWKNGVEYERDFWKNWFET